LHVVLETHAVNYSDSNNMTVLEGEAIALLEALHFVDVNK